MPTKRALRRATGSIALAALAGAAFLTVPASAQSLPPYLALNPLLTSRSGVYFQPYVDGGRTWDVGFLLDYGSSIEYATRSDASLILDGELLRLDATVIRNVGPGFVGISAGLNGSYDGFLDGFLDWYHDLTGLRVAAREVRPRNRFEFSHKLPNGDSLARPVRSSFLGDVRLMGGVRLTRHWQTTLAITLPTGPAGYGRETVSASLLNTVRFPLSDRWTTEAAFGIGTTPRAGALESIQKTTFVSASGGLRFRFWGRQAAFINLFYQSANYEGVGLRAFDGRELTIDYGFLLKAKKGPEWFLGMTEDLEPLGPAIDLSFRIGARW